MKNAMALTLVLGLALPAAAMAQESSTQKPVAKPEARVAKPPAKASMRNRAASR